MAIDAMPSGGERRLRVAAAGGDFAAMCALAEILHGRGLAVEAERWVRRGAERGHVQSMVGLGALLDQRGATREAESWYLTAAQAGSSVAACRAALMAEERGDARAARLLYRQAAEGGDTLAILEVAQSYIDDRDLTQALAWLGRALAVRDSMRPFRRNRAMALAVMVLTELGRREEARYWVTEIEKLASDPSVDWTPG